MQNRTSKTNLKYIGLEKSLRHAGSKDVNSTELCGKLKTIARRLVPNSNYTTRKFKLQM